MPAEAYTCVEPFAISKIDEDGYTVDSESIIPEKDSIWYRTEKDTRIVGGLDSIYLENSSAWIEITPERFKRHFRKVQENG